MNEQKKALYEKLTRLQWLLNRYLFQTHLAHGPWGDPMRGQGRVLAILKLQPQISTRDLSYLLGIRPSSLNELLGKLEKNGYITRSQSEEDKRVVMVSLTDKGKNEPQQDFDFGNILDCLSEDEQKAFGKYLERVIAALEAQVGDEPGDFDWIAGARERLGSNFDRLLAMRSGGHPFGGFGPRFGRHCGQKRDDVFGRGFSGCGKDSDDKEDE